MKKTENIHYFNGYFFLFLTYNIIKYERRKSTENGHSDKSI